MLPTSLEKAQQFVTRYKTLAADTREYMKTLVPGSKNYAFMEREIESHFKYANRWKSYIDTHTSQLAHHD